MAKESLSEFLERMGNDRAFTLEEAAEATGLSEKRAQILLNNHNIGGALLPGEGELWFQDLPLPETIQRTSVLPFDDYTDRLQLGHQARKRRRPSLADTEMDSGQF